MNSSTIATMPEPSNPTPPPAEAPCAGCAALRKALKEVRGDFEVMSSNAAAADAGWTEAQDRAQAAEAREARLVEALEEIAHKPFGHAEATHREVLDAITEYARAALAEARRGG